MKNNNSNKNHFKATFENLRFKLLKKKIYKALFY